MRCVMTEQLVCTRCWKWFDGRNLCPTCRVPLVSPETGRPPGEPEAPAGATPADAPPARKGGDGPPLAAEAFVPALLPRMSGYPTGTPVTPPPGWRSSTTWTTTPSPLPAHPDPWRPGWHCCPRLPQARPLPWTSRCRPSLRRPTTRRSPPLRLAADRRSALSGPPSPRLPGRPPRGPEATRQRRRGRSAPPPRRRGPHPPWGRPVLLVVVSRLRRAQVRAAWEPPPRRPLPGRTEALPLGWQPGVSLGRPLATGPATADPQPPTYPQPMSRPLPLSPPAPPGAPPDAPPWTTALGSPDRPPAPPAAPPPAPPPRPRGPSWQLSSSRSPRGRPSRQHRG